ncbi:unnamed protein product [Prorocentrum cordatum]|uniref:Uncharacterized protein n=1 Tax=Prorocentrum cordatum TaxID=2364126 RepID=A0ABN9SGK3_9DINO|nr:unnamed protein product [Polarella glacialis]
MAVRSGVLTLAVLCAAAGLVAMAATSFVPAPLASGALRGAGASPAAAALGAAVAAVPSAAHAAKGLDPLDTILRLGALVTILIGPIVGFGLIPVIFGRDVSKK